MNTSCPKRVLLNVLMLWLSAPFAPGKTPSTWAIYNIYMLLHSETQEVSIVCTLSSVAINGQ